jgi:[ribosomal protein S18]-alanine N-acetyltransferase
MAADSFHNASAWPERSSASPQRPMTMDDIAAVLAIEVGAYSHPWTRGNFVDSLVSGYDAQVWVLGSGSVVAYSVVMPGVDEDHILNLTVERAQQGRGWGQRVLRQLIDGANARGSQGLWLEVRASNAAALALYERFGFVRAGRRRDYYPASKGREDAVLMSLALGSSPQEPR